VCGELWPGALSAASGELGKARTTGKVPAGMVPPVPALKHSLLIGSTVQTGGVSPRGIGADQNLPGTIHHEIVCYLSVTSQNVE